MEKVRKFNKYGEPVVGVPRGVFNYLKHSFDGDSPEKMYGIHGILEGLHTTAVEVDEWFLE